jgi:hypothetical protein
VRAAAKAVTCRLAKTGETGLSLRSLFLALILLAFLPVVASAEESRFFAGLDVLGGAAFGSSSTTDGGAPFANGGVVKNVKFGKTVGLGGHVGYRVDRSLSGFISYQHIRGDIDWDADFPFIGAASQFEGKAISNAILGNVAYDLPLSDTTAVRATAGLGLTFNSLSDVVETDGPTGLFLSDVESHTKISPMVQIGAGIQYEIAPNALLGLDASFAYVGGFETGNTRNGNLGVTDINPYRIDDVWRANLSASITIMF